jgi:hypothetical protein
MRGSWTWLARHPPIVPLIEPHAQPNRERGLTASPRGVHGARPLFDTLITLRTTAPGMCFGSIVPPAGPNSTSDTVVSSLQGFEDDDYAAGREMVGGDLPVTGRHRVGREARRSSLAVAVEEIGDLQVGQRHGPRRLRGLTRRGHGRLPAPAN